MTGSKTGSISEMTSTLILLSDFLYGVGAEHFASYFGKLGRQFEGSSSEEDMRRLAQEGLSMFGGMGSFNDLVIVQGDGTVDAAINQRLDELRMKVFRLLRDL